MVHVYIRPMLPFGAWTSLKGPIPGASSSTAFYPVATVLHVVSDSAALQWRDPESSHRYGRSSYRFVTG